MIRFIRYFIMEWRNYPHYEAFRENLSTKCPEEYAKMYKSDIARGINPEYKSRFDFALRNALVHYAHRDRYGRKCREFGGNCEICTAKHC